MDTSFKASNPDDEDGERIARRTLAAMQAAGFSAELGVEDERAIEVVSSSAIAGTGD